MLVDKPPAGDRWLHEIKLDGYRTAARIESGQVHMLTRKGLDWTGCFGPIARTLEALPVRAAYLDGEIVVVRPDGVSSFADLQEALSLGQANRLSYYAFDLFRTPRISRAVRARVSIRQHRNRSPSMPGSLPRPRPWH